MLRGEVWRVSFTGSSGGEVRKTRPPVIVSNNAANLHTNRIQIVLPTSKTGKLYPCEALVSVDGSESKAMADRITTVSKGRLLKFLGVLSPHDLHRVEIAIHIQLGLAV